jgi:hypothetical protein
VAHFQKFQEKMSIITLENTIINAKLDVTRQATYTQHKTEAR